MLSFLPKNPQDITEELRTKFKERRKSIWATSKQSVLHVQMLALGQ